jgi:hypothetical protein
MTKQQVEDALAANGTCGFEIVEHVDLEKKAQMKATRPDLCLELLTRDRMMRFISHALPAEDMTFTLKWSTLLIDRKRQTVTDERYAIEKVIRLAVDIRL